jgi:hypothetical protein
MSCALKNTLASGRSRLENERNMALDFIIDWLKLRCVHDVANEMRSSPKDLKILVVQRIQQRDREQSDE